MMPGIVSAPPGSATLTVVTPDPTKVLPAPVKVIVLFRLTVGAAKVNVTPFAAEFTNAFTVIEVPAARVTLAPSVKKLSKAPAVIMLFAVLGVGAQTGFVIALSS